jgi:hypothetical protein
VLQTLSPLLLSTWGSVDRVIGQPLTLVPDTEVQQCLANAITTTKFIRQDWTTKECSKHDRVVKSCWVCCLQWKQVATHPLPGRPNSKIIEICHKTDDNVTPLLFSERRLRTLGLLLTRNGD